MKNRTERCLMRILEYCNKILSYTSNYSFDDFASDTKTLEAVVFNLSQIGELANFVDDQTKMSYPNVEWHGMRGLRNRIIHDYEGIRPFIIWSIITDDLEKLIENIEVILKDNI